MLIKKISFIGICLFLLFALSACNGGDGTPIPDTDNTEPVITVTGVVDGVVYTTSVTPQISANEEVTWEIVLTKNGIEIDYTRGDTISQAGDYEFTIIKATDNAGNEQIHDPISFKISNDYTAPSVNITSPSGGATLGENPVTVQWDINDESPYTWELYIGGTTDPNATGDQDDPHYFTFDPLDTFVNYSGGVRIRIEAVDEVGNDSTDYVDVMMETRADLVFGDNGGEYGYWYDIVSGADYSLNLIIYVANDGPSTAGESTVRVYFPKDDRYEYIPTPAIEPGENIELPSVEMPSVGGGDNIDFDVILDFHDDVDESDETNNEDSVSIVT